MNILFYYTGYPSPILETELELIQSHQIQGDTINIFNCNSNLDNCFWNPNKNKFKCNICQSKFNNAIKLLDKSQFLNVHEFPKNNISHTTINIFNNVDDLKSFHYDDSNIGRGVASRLISLYRDHRFDTVKHSEQIVRELNSAIKIYDTFKHYISKNKVDKVYIFNGRITTEYPVILLCRKFNIKYATYEVAYTNNCYTLRENSIPHDVNTLSDEMFDLWKKHGESNIFNCHEYFKNKRARIQNLKFEDFATNQIINKLPLNLNNTKINIGIFNSTIDEYAAVEGWDNPLYNPDETVGIRMILEDFRNLNEYHFYLRVHPNMKDVSLKTSQLHDIEKLVSEFNNLTVIWPNDQVDSYSLLDACDKIITFGSTIGIEAAYWGNISILAGRAIYEKLDCIYKPANHHELITLIKSDLKALNNYSTLLYANREITHGIPFKYFKETKMINGLTVGTFNGINLKSSILSVFLYKTSRLPSYIITLLKSMFKKPL
jgi:hypothetical protein